MSFKPTTWKIFTVNGSPARHSGIEDGYVFYDSWKAAHAAELLIAKAHRLKRLAGANPSDDGFVKYMIGSSEGERIEASANTNASALPRMKFGVAAPLRWEIDAIWDDRRMWGESSTPHTNFAFDSYPSSDEAREAAFTEIRLTMLDGYKDFGTLNFHISKEDGSEAVQVSITEAELRERIEIEEEPEP